MLSAASLRGLLGSVLTSVISRHTILPSIGNAWSIRLKPLPSFVETQVRD
jgi:hypothetical protein